MCYFHVKKAVKEWVGKHFRGSPVEKKLAISIVSSDLDTIHISQSKNEFYAKVEIILDSWHANGLVAATSHDANGQVANLATYFRSQWVQQVKEWQQDPF